MKLIPAAILTALLLAACGDSDLDTGPLMQPGEDCLGCHGSEAVAFSAAGTVYAAPDAEPEDGLEGVTIEIVDSEGTEVSLVSNAAGNFYTAEELVPPFETAVEKDGVRFGADEPIEGGACNSCHTVPPSEDDVEGRLYWANE